MNDDIYVQELLINWEEIYKGGQLTLWVLLALYEGPKTKVAIQKFIDERTSGIIYVDDKSMYRSLRRYHTAELIENVMIPSKKGPDAKKYNLTPIGKRVLKEFIQRNINTLYYVPNNEVFIKGVLHDTQS